MLKQLNSLKTNKYNLVNIIILAAAICLCLQVCVSGSVTISPVTSKKADALLIIDNKVQEIPSLTLVRGFQLMIAVKDLEKLGWGYLEPSAAGQAVFRGNGITLTFIKGKDTALVNSLPVRLPVVIYTKDGRLMVPLSFVASSLGHSYEMETKPVARINTQFIKTNTSKNSIKGKVLFNGKGMHSIIVRLIDKYRTSDGSMSAVTNDSGEFLITNVPDGEYSAYIYTGDNPKYFNRESELISIKNGKMLAVKPISLGALIIPVSPAIASIVKNIKGSLSVSWSAVSDAASYKIVVKKVGSDKGVDVYDSQTASVKIPSAGLLQGNQYELQIFAYNTAGDFIGGTPSSGVTPWIFSVE